MSYILKKPVNGIISVRKTSIFICLLLGAYNLCQAQLYWERLPKPVGRAEGFGNISFDESGMLWALAANKVVWWDGEQFREAAGAELSSGYYLAGLYGDIDRGLYVTQSTDELHMGEVYHLNNGQAVYVTDFRYDVGHDTPGFYMAKDGRFINWGEEFLRIYDDRWYDYNDVDLMQRTYPIYDLGQTICIYNQGTLISIDSNNQISSQQIRSPDDEYTDEVTVQWGDDKALFLMRYQDELEAYDLSRGEYMDVNSINSVLEGHRLHGMANTSDGSVWVLAWSWEESGYCVFRISPEGHIELILPPMNLTGTYENYFRQSTHSILPASDGSIWFGVPEVGIVRYQNNQLYHFDYRENPCNPSSCAKLLEGPDNTIFILSGYWLYQLKTGESSVECPWSHLPEISRPEVPVWRYEPEEHSSVQQAWQIEEYIVCDEYRWDGGRIVTLNVEDGSVQFELEAGSRRWVMAGREPGTMLSLSDQNHKVVDLHTGQILGDLEFDRDRRIEPVLVEQDYVMVEGYRGEEICRITTKGHEVWSCDLPGYVLTHPIMHGNLLAVQTRGSSYGGQTTSMIDLDTGEMLWSDVTDAYGCGVDFASDGKFMVEANCWLSPEMTEGRLLARKPFTGVDLWHYQRQVNMIFHHPIIDSETDSVYAFFDDGTVVCLKGKSGMTVWETLLPDKPRQEPGANYFPYWPSISMKADYILVIDRNDVVYFLDKMNGRVIARLDVITEATQHGIRIPATELVTMPCIIGDMILVATEQSVEAYNLNDISGL